MVGLSQESHSDDSALMYFSFLGIISYVQSRFILQWAMSRLVVALVRRCMREPWSAHFFRLYDAAVASRFPPTSATVWIKSFKAKAR